MKRRDLVIIGSGPGGYVAGLYGAGNNLNVCVIEKDSLGGTCLNRGCIPTKVMLNSASLLSRIRESSVHGIVVDNITVNFQKINERKEEVVSRLRAGIETLFRAKKIELIKGTAVIKDRNTVVVDGARLESTHVIIATGSRPSGLSGIEFDNTDIFSSDGILNINKLPKTLLIIGGGVIGCEFATIFNTLGTKVTIVELLDRLLVTQSREASKKMEIILKKRGVEVITSAKVERIDKKGALNIKISNGRVLNAEKVLVAVGRTPNVSGLGLEDIGIKIEKGYIAVDGYLRTAIDNIYAIGDCITGGPLLAHKASYDGILACDNILGRERLADYSSVPNCVYTEPEIASVGLNEEEARAKYADVKIARFPYLGSGKAFLIGRTEGFIKIVGNSKGEILGIEIMGEEACDLVGEATLAKASGINIKDLSHVVHGHPTLSEIFQEAAHIFSGTAIHSI